VYSDKKYFEKFYDYIRLLHETDFKFNLLPCEFKIIRRKEKYKKIINDINI
jgi:hypothetical protein